MGGVDRSIILKRGQSDVKFALVKMVSTHGPKIVLVHKFCLFGIQNLSHNANYNGSVVLTAFAQLGLWFLVDLLVLKIFVAQDTLFPNLMGYEDLQKVICDFILDDFFKLCSDNVD